MISTSQSAKLPEPSRQIVSNSLRSHIQSHRLAPSDTCTYCLESSKSKDFPKKPTYEVAKSSSSSNQHNAQHPNCKECLQITIPIRDMKMISLPRINEDEKRIYFSERKLGPEKYARKFKNGTSISNLEFLHYRRPSNSEPYDSIKLQNYNNYQSIGLVQNIEDIAQNVIKTKEHLADLHLLILALNSQQEKVSKDVNEKLEIIMEALAGSQEIPSYIA